MARILQSRALRELTFAALAASTAISPAAARKPVAVWQYTRTSDPMTGATSCVVTAYDRAAGLSFSTTGSLYPVVENSSIHGLLIGVSSGGRVRLPTGDILWRVDDQPPRLLAAADNPAGAAPSAIPPGVPGMQELVDQQMRLVTAATATSTLASGDKARAMLREMLAGKGLLYRAASAAPQYGLPSSEAAQVGLMTKDGPRPYPLDDSFRAGLAACGISADVSPPAP